MKVLIINSGIPFVRQEVDQLADYLVQVLINSGHKAEVMRLPCQINSADDLVRHMVMTRCFRLHNVEHVITLQFPAHLICHPRKTIWLVEDEQGVDIFQQNKMFKHVQHFIESAIQQSCEESRRVFSASLNAKNYLRHLVRNKPIKELLPPTEKPFLLGTDQSKVNMIWEIIIRELTK